MSDPIPIIDVDTHLSEVPDLWTSRISEKRWGDAVPHVVHDERLGMDRWLVGGKKLTSVSNWATAGWSDYPPSHPPTLEQAHPAAFFAASRVARMDQYGIQAEVLYPNLITFSNHAFRDLDPELAIECIKVYNDFLNEFASEGGNRDRFVLLAAVPFWDVDATLAEIQRCADLGFQGLLFLSKPYKVGLPPISDPHWEPVFALVGELGWSVNFHTGFAEFSEDDFKAMLSRHADRRDYARLSAVSYFGNAETICEVVMSGLCHRHPNVNFVAVESAFGWVPSLVESMDWQWLNSGAAKAFPEMEMPSFYFRRQVYGMFWFERESVRRQLDLFPDNVMFESDFPHPTSLSPGPASAAHDPRETANSFFAGFPEGLKRKVLFENAARVYGVRMPASSG